MTKQELSNKVAELWNELNSDISKDSKLNILLELEELTDVHVKPSNTKQAFIISCTMIIEEFRKKLEENPNHKEKSQISDLGYFLLAISNSSLSL